MRDRPARGLPGLASTLDLSRVDRDDRDQVREISRLLEVIDTRSPSALRGLVAPLRRLVRSDASLAYTVQPPSAETPGIQDLFASGIPATRWRAATATADRALPKLVAYDPRRPDVRQRNRVRSLEWLKRHEPSVEHTIRTVWARLGIQDSDQLRVLICDGPALLAWVGANRFERYGRREAAALSALVPGLVRRLRLEASLANALLYTAAFERALNLLDAPAYLLDARGRIQHANDRGTAALQATTDPFARRSSERPGGAPKYDRFTLAVPGLPDHALLVGHSAPESAQSVADAARAAATGWSLSPRQIEVLEGLLEGLTNRSIADRLGCAVGTAEIHVSAVLRKAGASSRAELIASVWRDVPKAGAVAARGSSGVARPGRTGSARNRSR